MPRRPLIRCFAHCLLLVVALTAGRRSRASEPIGSIVILRNGNILAGAVHAAGAYYRVEQSGATLQIPTNQVETVCGSLHEAYEVRRRNRVGSSVDSNLELARWCLRHNLLDQAAREILDARTKDANHPALKLLDLQLRQQLEIVAKKARAASEQKPLPAPAAHGSGVVPASYDAPAPPGPDLLEPSTEAQAEFVRSIQPMLVHGCTTGGCHQVDSRHTLQLDRWALQGNGNPVLIKQNLKSVLAHINREDPPSSPLVRWARQGHGAAGGRPSTPLGSYQTALLLDWLNEVCGIEPAPLGTDAGASAYAEEGAAPLADPFAADEAAPNQRRASPVPAPPDKSAPTAARAPQPPRDAFDPEMFNRRTAAAAQARAADRDAADAAPPLAPDAESTATRDATAEEAAALRALPPATE